MQSTTSLLTTKGEYMARIDDFEKRYVSSVSFKSGDKILVTKENIKDRRQNCCHQRKH